MATKSIYETGEGIKKPVRTISGVTPLTVVLEPRKCDHGTCIYCPGGERVPQSYTDKSPAVMRALALRFDPYEQVKARLNVLKRMGHPTDKIEIIVLGGTFLQYPKEYKYNFIKSCFDALNEVVSNSLEEAKKINETAKNRCVALCIENRPDNCSIEDIKEMLDFGATRIELGVQMPDDELYKKTNRGHLVRDVVDATKRLKDYGFKIGYHIMPGLPGSNPAKDLVMFKEIFDDSRFRPDQLKIYPCQVIEDSPLGRTHKMINFEPYSEEVAKKLLIEMMKIIPNYCRVMRMLREFPKEKVISGLEKLDLRKDIEEEFRNKGVKINEIRMREVGFNKNLKQDLRLRVSEYDASEGKEFFIEVINEEEVLFGLLRLRLTNNQIIEELKHCALVRELHVYGKALNIGTKDDIESQHRGIGKMLMNKAEEISKSNGYSKIAVISGVGVRDYYKKLGYSLDEYYMVKDI